MEPAVDGWSADTVGDSPVVWSLATRPDRASTSAARTPASTARKRLTVLDAASGDVVSVFDASPNGPVKEVVVCHAA